MDSSSISSRTFQKAPAQYPRASSRTSTRSASTRMTSQGVRSPVPGPPRLAPSPQLSIDHPSHRYHHSSYKEQVLSPRSTPKPTPQASREGSVESPVPRPFRPSYMRSYSEKERPKSTSLAKALYHESPKTMAYHSVSAVSTLQGGDRSQRRQMDRAPNRAAAMTLPRSPGWASRTWTMYVTDETQRSY